MLSGEDYSSDSYSGMKLAPGVSKKNSILPSKAPVQKSVQIAKRPIVNTKRPIPYRTPAQNSVKKPLKPISQPNNIDTSQQLKRIPMPDGYYSESYSYYDYDYDEDMSHPPVQKQIPNPISSNQPSSKISLNKNNENIKKPENNQRNQNVKKHETNQRNQNIKKLENHQKNQNIIKSENHQINQNIKSLNKQQSNEITQRPENHQRTEIIQNPMIHPNVEIINNPLGHKDYFQNDESSSGIFILNGDENGFCDTNEEPEIKISQQAIDDIRSKSAQSILRDQIANMDTDTASIKDSVIYRVTAEKSGFTHCTYQLFNRDICLMSAFSSNTRKSVDFKVVELFEKDAIVKGNMSISKNRRQFNLSSFGTEVLSATVSTIKKPIFNDRFFTVNFKNPDPQKRDLVLRTMIPKSKQDNGKSTKKSIKNVILVDNNNDKLLIVKRIGDTQLEIEVSPMIKDELQIFAFGVISWICPY